NTRTQVLLWAAQRASAAVLALCVAVHLVTIIYAVRNGLSAAEILGRTRGNVAWALFYVTFVLAAGVHAGIGLRTVFAEWLEFRGREADFAAFAFTILVSLAGLRAVW